MRVLLVVAAMLFVLTTGTSASANGVNNFLAGINGILTFAADPVMATIDPPDEFDDMFGAPVTPHVVGLIQGSLLSVYRAAMGALDIAFSPFWVFPTLSPEARYEIIPGYEIEYE